MVDDGFDLNITSIAPLGECQRRDCGLTHGTAEPCALKPRHRQGWKGCLRGNRLRLACGHKDDAGAPEPRLSGRLLCANRLLSYRAVFIMKFVFRSFDPMATDGDALWPRAIRLVYVGTCWGGTYLPFGHTPRPMRLLSRIAHVAFAF